MRTFTETRTAYQFDELTEKAKDAAIERHFNAVGWSWSEEAMASLKALADHFGGRLADWQVDFFGCSHSSAKFVMPEDFEDDAAAWHGGIEDKLTSLGTYDPQTLKGHGGCKLTGFCFDESAIDGFRKAFHDGETDLESLMQSAFCSWLADCLADCADQQSYDQFSETCEANGYEFDENGELI